MSTTPPTPSDALAACPFCGETAMVDAQSTDLFLMFGVGCPDEMCPGHPTVALGDRYEAIQRWNRRTPEPPRGPSSLDRGAREGDKARAFDHVRALFWEFCDVEEGRAALRCIGEFIGEWEHRRASPSHDVRAQEDDADKIQASVTKAMGRFHAKLAAQRTAAAGDEGLLGEMAEALRVGLDLRYANSPAVDYERLSEWEDMARALVARYDAINPPKESGR